MQDEALNGAQITSLQGIVEAVAAGMLPKDSAKALIRVGFPGVGEGQINGILAPIIPGVISNGEESEGKARSNRPDADTDSNAVSTSPSQDSGTVGPKRQGDGAKRENEERDS